MYKNNLRFLKTDPKARYQGYLYYFREGFCWSAVNGTRSTNDLKFRFKQKSVTDVQGMSLYSISNKVSSKFITCICNSEFISRYTETYVNSTVIFQINDARQIPIIIPTFSQQSEFVGLFDKASSIKREQLLHNITKKDALKKLKEVQDTLAIMVETLYNLI